VGKITRAHGVKGEVSILPLSGVESRFEPGALLFLDDDGSRRVTVAAARRHQKRLLVRFEEIGARDGAEALRGLYLFVPVEASPALPEGEYWAHQLIGCRVETEEGDSLGAIREVVHSTANDVWVAASEAGEVLIPALRDVVSSVDVAARRIVVRAISGLTAP
jgi:16S rRNA processing protein RimM